MNRPSIVPRGITLDGDVEGTEDLVVFGRIHGEIRIDGVLVVEESGVVRGDVFARSVTVRGELAGDAWGQEFVRVDAAGRLVGDLNAPRVKVVDGARFRGRVHMADSGDQPPRHVTRPSAEARPADEQRAPLAEAPHPREPSVGGGPPRMPRLRRTRGRRRHADA